MLFKRYSDPVKLLDLMIQTGGFHEFVCDVLKAHMEEQQEEAIWDMWLHKVFDETFAQFRRRVVGSEEPAPKKEKVAEIIGKSFGMLEGFVPDGVQENDGTVSAAGDSSHRHE